MQESCVAVGCGNHNMMGKNISFYIFQNRVKKKARWEKWVQAMRRMNADGSPWYPKGTYIYICLEHFITGKDIFEPYFIISLYFQFVIHTLYIGEVDSVLRPCRSTFR